MRRFVSVVALAPVAVGCTPGNAAFSQGDVEFWVGQGASRAVLVIDWDTGPDPVSLAWGYRWDGAATGEDMLMAVIAADTRFYARFEAFGFGNAVIGLGYDLDGDGFSISDGTAFDGGGVSFAGRSDGATANDADDHYVEGWNTGFWSYWQGAGEPFAGGAWAEAMVGLNGRMLTDGDWDGLRFAPGFVGEAPREPAAAVPGPASLGAVLAGGVAFRRRRPGG